MRLILALMLSLMFMPLAAGFQAALAESKQDASVPLTPEVARLFRQQVQEITAAAVIDPLTFSDSNGVVYRLAGIDVPDMYAVNAPDLVREAKEYVAGFVKGAKLKTYQTKNESKGRTNRMDQQLVHVAKYPDNEWLQGELVAKGYARVWPTVDNAEGYVQLLALEDKARAESLGLWALPQYRVLADTQAEAGRFAIVRGKILSVSTQSNMLFLNFGHDWRSDFTIGISPAMRRELAKKQIDIQSYAGKNVEVRGMVESYYGPFISLMDISQLRIVEEAAPVETAPAKSQDTAIQPEKPATQNRALRSLSVSPLPDTDLENAETPPSEEE